MEFFIGCAVGFWIANRSYFDFPLEFATIDDQIVIGDSPQDRQDTGLVVQTVPFPRRQFFSYSGVMCGVKTEKVNEKCGQRHSEK